MERGIIIYLLVEILRIFKKHGREKERERNSIGERKNEKSRRYYEKQSIYLLIVCPSVCKKYLFMQLF